MYGWHIAYMSGIRNLCRVLQFYFAYASANFCNLISEKKTYIVITRQNKTNKKLPRQQKSAEREIQY